MLNHDCETIEIGMEELKKGIETRDKMGGSLYWNILNDECLKLADKLVSSGANKEEIAKIASWGISLKLADKLISSGANKEEIAKIAGWGIN